MSLLPLPVLLSPLPSPRHTHACTHTHIQHTHTKKVGTAEPLTCRRREEMKACEQNVSVSLEEEI